MLCLVYALTEGFEVFLGYVADFYYTLGNSFKNH